MEKNIESIRAVLPQKQEGIKELSEKVLLFLINLSCIDEELFSNWYEQGRSKEEARKNKVLFE